MSPDRRTEVNGNKIEEYYWAGKMVTYINNRAFEGTYEEAIKHCETSPNPIESEK
jgi:hypothetical protein